MHGLVIGQSMLELIAVHGDPLGVPTQFTIGRWADGPATTGVTATTSSAAFLQGHQLLSAEGLVVDLAGGFNEILEMGAGQEVAQVHEFAVVLVFDVDHAPAVLSAADLFSVDNDVLLAADDGKWDDILAHVSN